MPFLFLDATSADGFATVGLDPTATRRRRRTRRRSRRARRATTRETVAACATAGLAAALAAFADTEPAPLRWGEVIPLSFLNATLGSTSLVVLGQPARRQTEEVAMVPELLSLGRALFESLDALSARVLVVVSGDLAHTHLASGPYGYNPAAVPFDAALGAWASSLDPAPLLENATALADDAKSCGFTGAVMLHGLLNASCGRFTPRLLANAAPTYYGHGGAVRVTVVLHSGPRRAMARGFVAALPHI